ncbi:hypothetical protein [Burkholderia sp. Ac-20353]|uniref:Vgb family protein n=1 Tax=Burkholderia sp. Ac-20353 TaxID=2703894 RepID=UPI00197C51A9|nr:hypothetical protein [Burkholderia sp. Ac-20353]MBN3788501.1 hypothetical protein [Burkholderia sp. Ac-20353]
MFLNERSRCAANVDREKTKAKRRKLAIRLTGWLMATGFLCAGTTSMAQLFGSSPQVTEYALPNLAAGPCELKFDSRGILWIEDILGNAISRFDPGSGGFSTFPLSQPVSVPGGMEIGPDGALWFPQVATNVITRLDTTDGSMQNYPIPVGQVLKTPISVGTALASAIATGKDGAMWFSLSGVNAVGRIDVSTKNIEIIPLPTPLSTASVLTQIIQPGPGNTMVISLAAANKIATIDVFTRQINQYDVPTPAALPQGVTTDHNGIIWFTETAAQKFGRLDVNTGNIIEYDMLSLQGLTKNLLTSLGMPLPFPGPIREGSDGNIYIAEGGFQGGNKIAQFNPATNTLKEFAVPTPLAGICDLNSTRAGQIWFGEVTGNKIGKLMFGS